MRVAACCCLALSAALFGCSAGPFNVTEPFSDADIRVFVAIPRPGEPSVTAVGGAVPFRLDLQSVLEADGEAEVWVFGFEREQIEQAFPETAGQTLEQIARMLKPTLGTDEAESLVPTRVARTQVDGVSAVPTYRSATWQDWLAGVAAQRFPPFSLGKIRTLCERVAIERVANSVNSPLRRVQMTSDSRGLFFGPITASTRRMIVGQIVDGRVSLPTPRPAINGSAAWAAYDGDATVHVTGSRPGQLYALDVHGAVKTPAVLPPNFSAGGVSRGANGTIYFFGSSGIVRLDGTSSVAQALAGYERAANSMFAASDELIAAYDSFDKDVSVFGGSTWEVELTVSSFDSLYGITGDRETLLAYGKAQLAYVREAGRWQKLPEPFESGHFRDAAAIGEGRFIVVASNSYQTPPSIGQAGIWSGTEWCRLDLPMSGGLEGVDVTPNGETAYIVGNNDRSGDRTASIWRLDLSDL